MITNAILVWFSSFIEWAGSLLQLPEPPDFMNTLSGLVAQVSGYLQGSGAWIPWSVIGAILTAWAAAFVVAITLKVVRIVLSFLTAGGGSAA